MSHALSPLFVLLVTHPTSGVGRRMESVLARLQAKEHDRIRIGRVNADLQPELVRRLKVSEIPSVVLVKDRAPVAWLPGRATFDEIEEALASHLEPDSVQKPLAHGSPLFPAPPGRVPESPWQRAHKPGLPSARGPVAPKC